MTTAILPTPEVVTYAATLSDAQLAEYLADARDLTVCIIDDSARRRSPSRRTVEVHELIGKELPSTLTDSLMAHSILRTARGYELELEQRGLPVAEWLDAERVYEFAKISQDYDAFVLPVFSDADEILLRAFGIRL